MSDLEGGNGAPTILPSVLGENDAVCETLLLPRRVVTHLLARPVGQRVASGPMAAAAPL